MLNTVCVTNTVFYEQNGRCILVLVNTYNLYVSVSHAKQNNQMTYHYNYSYARRRKRMRESERISENIILLINGFENKNIEKEN